MIHMFPSRFFNLNISMIQSGNLAVIIDPAYFPDEIQRINFEMERLKISQRYVLLTHTHGDHFAGVQELENCRLIMHRKSLDKSDKLKQIDLKYIRLTDRLEQVTRSKEILFPQSDYLVEDSQVLTLNDLEFHFYSIPGHASDLLLIYEKKHRCIWTGDMLINYRFPYAMESVKDYMESLKFIQNFVNSSNVKKCIPGHFNSWKNPSEILHQINTEQRFFSELIRMVQERYSQKMNPESAFWDLLSAMKLQGEERHAFKLNCKALFRELPLLTHYKESFELK